MPFSVHLRDRRGPEKMEIRMASLVTEAELLDSGATRVAFNDHLPWVSIDNVHWGCIEFAKVDKLQFSEVTEPFCEHPAWNL